MSPPWESSNGIYVSNAPSNRHPMTLKDFLPRIFCKDFLQGFSIKDFLQGFSAKDFLEDNVMRVGFPILALIIVVFASAMPIPLVNAQQQRNNQEGLSEKNKRTLSRMGPEDIFNMNGDDSRSRGTNSRGQRNARPTPTPSVTQRQAQTSATQSPAAQPSVTPVQQPSAPTPSATVAAAGMDSEVPQSPLGQGDVSARIDSKWAAPALIVMALVVSGALIFILSKLFEKIREGSSG
jgi:hypothetical protein